MASKGSKHGLAVEKPLGIKKRCIALPFQLFLCQNSLSLGSKNIWLFIKNVSNVGLWSSPNCFCEVGIIALLDIVYLMIFVLNNLNYTKICDLIWLIDIFLFNLLMILYIKKNAMFKY